jgi:hypothetical protein
MPKAGLEPACLAAPPPQDGVSANSTTSAFLSLPFMAKRSTHPWERASLTSSVHPEAQALQEAPVRSAGRAPAAAGLEPAAADRVAEVGRADQA